MPNIPTRERRPPPNFWREIGLQDWLGLKGLLDPRCLMIRVLLLGQLLTEVCLEYIEMMDIAERASRPFHGRPFLIKDFDRTVMNLLC